LVLAKFKPYDYNQMGMITVTLKEQLEPATPGYAIHHLAETKSALSIFQNLVKNDETGSPAFDPKIPPANGSVPPFNMRTSR